MLRLAENCGPAAVTMDKARDLPPCFSERAEKAEADHDAPAYARKLWVFEITTARPIQEHSHLP
jgi:hypothetical protein